MADVEANGISSRSVMPRKVGVALISVMAFTSALVSGMEPTRKARLTEGFSWLTGWMSLSQREEQEPTASRKIHPKMESSIPRRFIAGAYM